jgi:sialidase-1
MKKRVFGLLLLLIISALHCCINKNTECVLNTYQYQIPVLINNKDNPVLYMELISKANQDMQVKEVRISMDGTTNLNDIQTIRLLYSGKKKNSEASNMEPIRFLHQN